MRRTICLLLIAILGAMPIAGMAKQASADSPASAAQDMPCHQSTPDPDEQSNAGCDLCASASLCCAHFIQTAILLTLGDTLGVARIVGLPRISAGIVLPPLEPPPLPL